MSDLASYGNPMQSPSAAHSFSFSLFSAAALMNYEDIMIESQPGHAGGLLYVDPRQVKIACCLDIPRIIWLALEKIPTITLKHRARRVLPCGQML